MSTDPFARLGGFIYRRRKWVLGIWLVALLVCAPLAGKANGILKAGGIEVPGSGSKDAAQILSSKFKVSALNNAAIVFHSDNLKVGDARFKSQVKAAAARVRNAEGVTNVVTYYKTLLPTLVSKDRHTTVVFASLKGDEGTTQTYIKGVRKAIGNVTLTHYVTGEAAVNHDFSVRSDKDLRKAEVLTFTLVFLLLLVTFRTLVSAFLPLLLAAGAVLSGTAGIYLIGSTTNTSVFALNVASMIGLGLAIDFSLIVVSRFREELEKRGDVEGALVMTMATAGRSILYSAVTVMLGMIVMSLLVDLMVIRSISIGVLVVAFTSLIAGLTLLPAVLALLGPRVEKWRVLPKRSEKPEEEGFWYRWSHAIMRHPWRYLSLSLGIILILALPVLQLRMLGSTPKLLPHDEESVKGLEYIDDQFGKNELQPIQIVLTTPKGKVFTPKFLTGLDTLSNTLQADRRANGVTSLATYMAAEPRDGRYQHLKPNWDFWPAPDLSHATATNPTPGVYLKNYISVWTKVPYSPAYFGWGIFTFPTGASHQLKVAQTLQVYRVNTGSLTVKAGKPTTLWRKADFNKRHHDQTIAAGTAVTLQKGDQLVVQPLTPVTVSNGGSEAAKVIVAVIFHVRPGTATQTSWTDSARTTDPFQGIDRDIMGGGLGYTFPKNEAHVVLDLSDTKPAARFPRHFHPGPELISVTDGTLTIFSSPEMVITRPNTPAEEGKYDEPTPMHAGAFAVVQGYGIHRAINYGKVPAEVWSLRVLDSTKPEYFLVALRPFAKQFVNLDSGNDAAVVNVVPKYDSYDPRQEAFVSDIKNVIIPSISDLSGAQASVGGQTANFEDFHDKLYGRFPYVIAAVLILTFFVLMMFFQSVFLPLKAILMNLASILATYGVLVMIFQHGWGAGIFGFKPVGAVAVITPAILFVILFALSTDYEVFMLSRIKEYWNETQDNEESVAKGLQQTGRIVTAAGLILIGVFGSFATAGIITIKEIGLGLAIGVLIDTVIVRSIMVPATMRLAGNINWVMPAWLKRFVPELHEGPRPDQPQVVD
ncbi:MAG TPA: MMPL family transporter [Gaiellaceae bacterium]|nr:MMPL family transporter [Gaiellaceae bacterium]